MSETRNNSDDDVILLISSDDEYYERPVRRNFGWQQNTQRKSTEQKQSQYNNAAQCQGINCYNQQKQQQSQYISGQQQRQHNAQTYLRRDHYQGKGERNPFRNFEYHPAYAMGVRRQPQQQHQQQTWNGGTWQQSNNGGMQQVQKPQARGAQNDNMQGAKSNHEFITVQRRKNNNNNFENQRRMPLHGGEPNESCNNSPNLPPNDSLLPSKSKINQSIINILKTNAEEQRMAEEQKRVVKRMYWHQQEQEFKSTPNVTRPEVTTAHGYRRVVTNNRDRDDNDLIILIENELEKQKTCTQACQTIEHYENKLVKPKAGGAAVTPIKQQQAEKPAIKTYADIAIQADGGKQTHADVGSQTEPVSTNQQMTTIVAEAAKRKSSIHKLAPKPQRLPRWTKKHVESSETNNNTVHYAETAAKTVGAHATVRSLLFSSDAESSSLQKAESEINNSIDAVHDRKQEKVHAATASVTPIHECNLKSTVQTRSTNTRVIDEQELHVFSTEHSHTPEYCPNNWNASCLEKQRACEGSFRMAGVHDFIFEEPQHTDCDANNLNAECLRNENENSEEMKKTHKLITVPETWPLNTANGGLLESNPLRAANQTEPTTVIDSAMRKKDLIAKKKSLKLEGLPKAACSPMSKAKNIPLYSYAAYVGMDHTNQQPQFLQTPQVQYAYVANFGPQLVTAQNEDGCWSLFNAVQPYCWNTANIGLPNSEILAPATGYQNFVLYSPTSNMNSYAYLPSAVDAATATATPQDNSVPITTNADATASQTTQKSTRSTYGLLPVDYKPQFNSTSVPSLWNAHNFAAYYNDMQRKFGDSKSAEQVYVYDASANVAESKGQALTNSSAESNAELKTEKREKQLIRLQLPAITEELQTTQNEHEISQNAVTDVIAEFNKKWQKFENARASKKKATENNNTNEIRANESQIQNEDKSIDKNVEEAKTDGDFKNCKSAISQTSEADAGAYEELTDNSNESARENEQSTLLHENSEADKENLADNCTETVGEKTTDEQHTKAAEKEIDENDKGKVIESDNMQNTVGAENAEAAADEMDIAMERMFNSSLLAQRQYHKLELNWQ